MNLPVRKMWNFSSLGYEASQEGLCSMELVNKTIKTGKNISISSDFRIKFSSVRK
jgi:hypothetical protein